MLFDKNGLTEHRYTSIIYSIEKNVKKIAYILARKEY